jgi:hypothetical protein
MTISPRIGRIIFWMLLTATFLGLSSAVLLYSFGFRLNWQTKVLEQPGLLLIKSDPKDVTVSLDRKVVATQTPKTITLFTGKHQVTVTKEGYFAWTKSFESSAGTLSRFDNILLFLTKPDEVTVTDKTVVSEVVNAPRFGNGIQVFDTELWYNDRFVTRFSRAPSAAVTFGNRAYILFQLGNKIHTIEVDGGNDVTVLSLESETPSRFLLKEEGRVLLYRDGSEVREARIR